MNTSSGSKKITIAGIGLGAIVGTSLPTDNQSIIAYCIKIGAIAVITLAAILVQAYLDNK
jgi:hypothetical protein